MLVKQVSDEDWAILVKRWPDMFPRIRALNTPNKLQRASLEPPPSLKIFRTQSAQKDKATSKAQKLKQKQQKIKDDERRAEIEDAKREAKQEEERRQAAHEAELARIRGGSQHGQEEQRRQRQQERREAELSRAGAVRAGGVADAPTTPMAHTPAQLDTPPSLVQMKRSLHGLRAAQLVERTADREMQIGQLEFDVERREKLRRRYGQ